MWKVMEGMVDQSSCRGVSQAGMPGSQVPQHMFSVKLSWLHTAAQAGWIHWSQVVPAWCGHVEVMLEPRELVMLWNSFVPCGCECLALIRAEKLCVMNSVQLSQEVCRCHQCRQVGITCSAHVAHLRESLFHSRPSGAWEPLRFCCLFQWHLPVIITSLGMSSIYFILLSLIYSPWASIRIYMAASVKKGENKRLIFHMESRAL